MLIDLLSYRAWRDNWADADEPESAVSQVSDNPKAKLCPKCSRLMLKFKVSGEQPNMIDVCTACDEAWLDEGEWELLGALALQTQLTRIFTEPWQSAVRKAQTDELRMKRLEALIGREDLARVNEMERWIESHPKKAEILQILLGKFR